MDKEYKHYIEKIKEICINNKWDIKCNVKVDDIKIDVLITLESYSVGFNVCKIPIDVEKRYKALRNKRISCCWLLLDSNHGYARYDNTAKYLNTEFPCFKFNGINVIINSSLGNDYETSIDLNDFIPLITNGKIKLKKEIRVKYIDVLFIEEYCWKCKEKNHIFFIKHLIADDGFIYPYNRVDFNPTIISVVREHISKHPERNIKMGEIKDRISKTKKQTYLSFGCYKCDSLFGDHYINEAVMQEQYYYDPLNTVRIDVGNADIKYPFYYWSKNSSIV